MNYAHLHLIATHFPPVLSLGSVVFAAAGIARRRGDLVRLALLLVIAVGVMMPLVYLAGDRAADSIGKVEGVQQEAIAPHQRAATGSLVVSIVTGLAALVLWRRERTRFVEITVLVIALMTAAPIAWTAALGGAIHHPEINAK